MRVETLHAALALARATREKVSVELLLGDTVTNVTKPNPVIGLPVQSNITRVVNLDPNLDPPPMGEPPTVKRTDYDSEDFFNALYDKPTYSQDVLVSPNGKRILELSRDKSGKMNLLVSEISNNGEISSEGFVTNEERQIIIYEWAGDSENVIFYEQSQRSGKIDLRIMNTQDGKPPKTINMPDGFTAIPVYGFLKTSYDKPDQAAIMLTKKAKWQHKLFELDLKTLELTPVLDIPDEIEVNGKKGKGLEFIFGNGLEIKGAKFTTHDEHVMILVKDPAHEKDISKWRVVFDTKCPVYDHDHVLFRTPVSITEKKVFLPDIKDDNYALTEIDIDNPENSKIVFKDASTEILDVAYNPFSGMPEGVEIFGDHNKWIGLDGEYSSEFKDDIDYLKSQHSGELKIISRDANNETWVVRHSSSDEPPVSYIYKPKQKELSLLKNEFPELNEFKLAQTIPFSFHARDGLEIRAYITLPTDKPLEDLPLVINVHGGPFGGTDNSSWVGTIGSTDRQMIACRLGCAEVRLNFRGSGGQGQEFVKLGYREHGLKMQDDLVDLVNFLKSIEIDGKKLIDPKKIALLGQSYGGYAALVGAMKNHQYDGLFKCVAATEPPIDWLMWIKAMNNGPNTPEWLKAVYGDPKEDREKLVSNSPQYNIGNMQIPVYIEWGMQALGSIFAGPFMKELKIESPYKIMLDTVNELENKGDNRTPEESLRLENLKKELLNMKNELHEKDNFTIRLFPTEDHVPREIENNKTLKHDLERFLKDNLIV